MNELERFISLFNQEVVHTFDYLAMLDDAHWSAIPKDSDALFLGSRVNKITIGALTRHLMNAESHWLGQIAPLASGSAMPLPGSAGTAQEAAAGPWLIDAYKTAHAGNLDKLQALTPVVLEKEILFTGRRYTGIGFLWSILGHHAYHLGQIDLLMRQLGLIAPEYMEWPETGKLLG
ncbi:MAG TPA: DinB family protein [Burkholderiales bacterium]|nr:DinB family protein [Burkholderiales bacterium]